MSYIRRLLLLLLCSSPALCLGGVHPQGPAPSTALLHRAQKNLTRTIVHDIFSPPVASRIYLYANAAAYEALIREKESYASLHGQVADFPAIAQIPTQGAVNYQLAALYAFSRTGGLLVFSEHLLKDSVEVLLREVGEKNPATYQNSLRYGQAVSDSIMKWAAGDNYLATRKRRRYSYSKTPGKWMPTPPGFMDAIEPHWGKIRPVVLDSAQQFKPVPPPAFSTDRDSEFMKQAREVYDVTRQMTDEQRLIASYWDCNPFFLNTQGHLNFATKKLSPGGHWISIAGQAAASAKLDWPATSAAYVLTSIALFDSFISCWDEKYRSQMIRPETVINAHIDEAWHPLLQTPPFPEYTSGHSVISTAVATVLSDWFGQDFTFLDTTEVEYGLPTRRFTSFKQACDEAAISRLYGGIHYRAAIEQGQTQGAKVGECVLQKVRLKQ
ncbi:vanadium-dependent haloperoxidase [Telluribacter sp. SYSU D00476]|uniref:vanadium-dependent haloperoxidase n=1 Tax=Telluribacter sp. SYSU D00476 TaxID=2811430 RepID=UPI001FF41B0F|nr:vanadium-dependent haloperoxidase [Telluribacter sp. SYSU D00476]